MCLSGGGEDGSEYGGEAEPDQEQSEFLADDFDAVGGSAEYTG